MRTEIEVFDQILHFAKSNDKIRAVLLNGSRVNPNVKKDLFCDYDIVYVVTDPEYFLHNQEWIQYFGELVMMQQNNIESQLNDWCIFLMLYTDGIRIDLSIQRIENVNYEDTLTKVLLDKDNLIKEISDPSDQSYVTTKPQQCEFEKTINNILWCSTNAAKGLWREELPYVKYMIDVVIRSGITKLINWYIGMNNDWRINTGKAGKWFKRYLPIKLWNEYERTYVGPNENDIWNSMFQIINLTNQMGMELSRHLGYEYPTKDEERVKEYLERVQRLPKNAKTLE